MRFDKLKKQLELILLLSDARGYTVQELCDKMEVSRRNLYYLIDFLKGAGFVLFKQADKYHIDRRSPFFGRLLKTIQFTDTEMRTIYNLLLMAGNGNEMLNQLRHKIDSAYNFSVFLNSSGQKQLTTNVNILTRAIQNKRMVRIIGYSSPHSHSVKDRIVEPFYMMNNNQDVRCHELTSGMNKTFRINRMEDIEELDTPWIHEDKHRQVFTDIFMFSGEDHHSVTLRLGQLSRNLFVEEYPQGVRCLTPDGDSHWMLNIEVCDYRGLGRFVLGLFSDIEILSGDGFRQYINDQIAKMRLTALD